MGSPLTRPLTRALLEKEEDAIITEPFLNEFYF